MKCCRDCGALKELSEFYRHRMMTDGHLNSCKACRDAYVTAWNAKNRERKRELAKAATVRFLATPKGKATRCRLQAKRNAAEKRATPVWADHRLMEAVYRSCAERNAVDVVRWEVDHVVPLNSDLVCGLHTHANLRVVTASENRSKRNFHWPDMPLAA